MSVRLEGFRIRGFGPFDQEFSADLSALSPTARLIAICGENGAGKTTAVELALPGAMFRSTPTRGSLVELATARDAFLEARIVNGQAWTIRHMVDSQTGKSEALVLDADGVPALPDSKVRSFDAWAARHMPVPGVFFSSAFAPQGAGGFSGAKPSERKEVLLGILGPEVQQLEADAAHAREQVKAAKAALAMLEARIADERGRGGDLDFLQAEFVRLRGYVTASESLVVEAREGLAAAEEEARRIDEAAAQQRANRERGAALSGQLEQARQALEKLETKVRNNRAVLAEAATIRAAAARLPALREELARKRIELAAADAKMRQHAAAVVDAARAEATAMQRRDAAQQRASRAERARDGAVKLAEARKALTAAELEVADTRDALKRLGGKRLAGAEDRLEAAIGTLEVIAGGEDDPAGIAQDRIDSNRQQVEDARNLPHEIAGHEQALRSLEDKVSVLARDVRTCELNAEAAKDLAAANAEVVTAQAQVAEASARRISEGDAADAAGIESSAIGEALGFLADELASIEPAAAKAEPLSNAEARLVELAPQADAGKLELVRIEGELAALPKPAEIERRHDVARARRLVSEADEQLNTAHRGVAQAEQRLEQATESLARVGQLEGERQGLEADLADWTLIAADVGRDGLQAMVIDEAIPELNDVTNDLLHVAFGPRFTVDVRTQSADAKGRRLLETLDVWVIDTGNDEHRGREGLIETFSGGEKTILAEALSLALTRLACRLAGAERPTLIRDESAGQLSESNAPIWMAMLRRAADIIDVDRILFVNHNRATWDLADAQIRVPA